MNNGAAIKLPWPPRGPKSDLCHPHWPHQKKNFFFFFGSRGVPGVPRTFTGRPKRRKTAPGGAPKEGPMTAPDTPGRLQGALKRAQHGPKTAPSGPRIAPAQDGPGRAQGGPRRPHDGPRLPKLVQTAPRRPQNCSRRPPRRFHAALGRARTVANRHQDTPKTSSRSAQGAQDPYNNFPGSKSNLSFLIFPKVLQGVGRM